MKKTQEILGLPIISISDGMEVGKVKSIIVNADKGAIDYVVVDSGIQILSAKIIATDSILGIGEYAVTIESESSINDISKIPAAIDLLQKNIQVKGTKVLTKKGRLIGEIGDIFVDENECCSITGLEYIADITQKRIRIIPRESVITFGKNLVVVTDDVENTLLDRATQLGEGDKPAEAEKKNLVSFDDNNGNNGSMLEQPETAELKDEVLKADHIIAVDGDSYYKAINVSPAEETYSKEETVIEETEVFKLDDFQEIQPESTIVELSNEEESIDINNSFDGLSQPVSEEAPTIGGTFLGSEFVDETPAQGIPAAPAESNAASLFEQRQKQYLNGRRSTKTITDNTGNVIVSEGMLINHEIIDTAKNAGKLIELVMNNKA